MAEKLLGLSGFGFGGGGGAKTERGKLGRVDPYQTLQLVSIEKIVSIPVDLFFQKKEESHI